jgi:hypothetical protein
VRLRLRTYFVVLVGATLLPVVALAAYLSFIDARQDVATVRGNMVELSRALSLAVDGEVRAAVETLNALAASSALQRSDYEAFRREVEAVLKERTGWISVVRDDGQQLLNTRLDPGASLPRTDDHGWLQNVFGASPIFISGAITGPVVKTPFVAISRHVTQFKPSVVVTLSIAPDSLSEVLLRQRMPADWYGVIADRSGTIIARTRGQEFLGKPMTVKLDAAQGVMRALTLEGDDVYIA